MIDWHLLFIAIFFFATLIELAEFVHSLRYMDRTNHGTVFTVCATVLFLLITWNEW